MKFRMNTSNERMMVFDDEPFLLHLHKESIPYNILKNSDDPILTRKVRQVYYEYVKRMLENNINETRSEISEDTVINCAKNIELDALRMCMSSTLYREIMLKEINRIKFLTFGNIAVFPKSTNSCSTSVKDSSESNIAVPGELDIEEQITFSDPLAIERLNLYFERYSSPDYNNLNNGYNGENKEIPIDNTDCSSSNVSTYVNSNTGTVHYNEKHEPDKVEDCSENQNSTAVYNKVCEEMAKIFEPESVENKNELSDTSNSFTDRFFSCGEKDFWQMEHVINESRKDQNLSAMSDLNEKKYKNVKQRIEDLLGEDENMDISMEEKTQICKKRIAWHVRNSLSMYYKKKYFRSVDEFRILAKSIVSKLLEIDPYIDYKLIYRGISKVFHKKDVTVNNITQIQAIVSKVGEYVALTNVL